MTTTPLAALELLSTGGELRIADVTFTGDSSYPDVLEWLSRQARSQGAPVLVHSVERPSGQESWFSVDHDGSVHPAGPSSPSPERGADHRCVAVDDGSRTGGCRSAATSGGCALRETGQTAAADRAARSRVRRDRGSGEPRPVRARAGDR